MTPPRPSRRLGHRPAASSRHALPAALLALSLGLGVCRVGIAQTAAGDAVLLASTAPSYTSGMIVAMSDKLVLPAGASVTLLFRSGEMLRLRGPFEGSLDQARPEPRDGAVAVLAELLRIRGADASAIGGTRSATLGDNNPERSRVVAEDVLVSSRGSGTYCIQSADSVWIARPDGPVGRYDLRRGAAARELAWPPGAIRIPWPEDLPIEDGDRFELVKNGAARATLTFHDLNRPFASDAAWIATGMLDGCRAQFEPRLRGLAAAAPDYP